MRLLIERVPNHCIVEYVRAPLASLSVVGVVTDRDQIHNII